METITRQEAKSLGLKTYFTGLPCPHGHISERRVDNKGCVVCRNAYMTKHYSENTSSYEDYKKLHSDRLKEYAAHYYKKNADKINTNCVKYQRNNPDKVKQHRLRFRLKNPQISAALNAKRHASKLQATPAWLTKEHEAEILSFYKEAARLTREIGVEHHVDHIVPLQGRHVCGLHVPWNLQVLTAIANCSKNNRFEQEGYK